MKKPMTLTPAEAFRLAATTQSPALFDAVVNALAEWRNRRTIARVAALEQPADQALRAAADKARAEEAARRPKATNVDSVESDRLAAVLGWRQR